MTLSGGSLDVESEEHAFQPHTIPARGTVGAEASAAALWGRRRAQTPSGNSN
jgi:hypothetical protein